MSMREYMKNTERLKEPNGHTQAQLTNAAWRHFDFSSELNFAKVNMNVVVQWFVFLLRIWRSWIKASIRRRAFLIEEFVIFLSMYK
jgi:hypothetical protein